MIKYHCLVFESINKIFIYDQIMLGTIRIIQRMNIMINRLTNGADVSFILPTQLQVRAIGAYNFAD